MKEIFIDEIWSDIIDKNYFGSFYKDNIFKIAFLYKSDFKNTKFLRDYLLIIFDILGLNPMWKNRFVLILDELNNNAIEYGSGEWSINIFRLIWKLDGNKLFLNIEVEDEWNGKNPKTSTEMNNLRNSRIEKGFDNHNSIRGRGLFLIITKLVDELYFKDSDKWWLIVWVNKILEI